MLTQLLQPIFFISDFQINLKWNCHNIENDNQTQGCLYADSVKVTKDVVQAKVSIHPVNEKMMLNCANSNMKRTGRFKYNYESRNITKDKMIEQSK